MPWAWGINFLVFFRKYWRSTENEKIRWCLNSYFVLYLFRYSF
jgi:hypothetical protein